MSPAVRERLGYLDSLKLFLTVLVIAHHAAITYGATGSWFYVEPSSPAFRAAGTVFTSTNQFFFMGLFFFISGFFVPAALARKGRARFVGERLLRLGVPLVLFAPFVSPYLEHVSSLRSDRPTDGYWATLAEFVRRRDFPPGPLWFVETLLVFSTTYAFVAPTARLVTPRSKPLGNAHLVALASVLTGLTFVTRLFWRAGEEWNHLQLAFFPQYVVLFALGTMAKARGWLDALTPALVRGWISALVAIVLALVFLVVVYVPRGPDALAPFVGGLHLEALLLDVLENFYCVGASVTALVFFRQRFDGTSRAAKTFAPDAYAVYILHAPVIVALAVALGGVPVGPWIKFPLLTVLGTASCFAASHFVLRRFALLRRVL